MSFQKLRIIFTQWEKFSDTKISLSFVENALKQLGSVTILQKHFFYLIYDIHLSATKRALVVDFIIILQILF